MVDSMAAVDALGKVRQAVEAMKVEGDVAMKTEAVVAAAAAAAAAVVVGAVVMEAVAKR